MRELKFRAWDGEKFGYFHFHPNQISEPERGFLDAINGRWQQFTGLLDKNGVEIYEGDILDKKYKWEVQFSNGAFWLRQHTGKMGAELIYSLIHKRKKAGAPIEIIGNIYQHPELLKEKENV